MDVATAEERQDGGAGACVAIGVLYYARRSRANGFYAYRNDGLVDNDKAQAMDSWVQSELLQGQPWDVASAVDAKKRFDFLKYDPLGGRWLAVRQLYLQNPTLREPSCTRSGVDGIRT